MAEVQQQRTIESLQSFLHRKHRTPQSPILAVSTFSGCGISDMGYGLAGFQFLAQVEKDENRAEIGQRNFPWSQWFAFPTAESVDAVVKVARSETDRIDVLIATPPCQGLSSSNPSRGKRRTEKAWRNSAKNRSILDIIPLAERLRPRLIVAENVRQVLTHRARSNGRVLSIPELLQEELSDYQIFCGTINVADYGIPQVRRRAIMVAVHRREPCLNELNDKNLLPWPRSTHTQADANGRTPWITARQWMTAMSYERLSARSEKSATGDHPLHFVPHYDRERYHLVSDIPKNTGRSAYENNRCPSCHETNIAAELAKCPACQLPLTNRPIVCERGRVRLIKGFKSSYRRMHANRPASTITTNSSHIGSDNKIHPWENRVLSILECADLQTVPRLFDWSFAFDSDRTYLIRNLIGEAFPPYFTFLHGKVLRGLLSDSKRVYSQLESSS